MSTPTVEPFTRLSTVNTTISIAAPRTAVWPVVRAMDQWSNFQDIFSIALVQDEDSGQTPQIELGQNIEITASIFPGDISQTTLEEYDEIIEYERICWTLRGFSFLDGAISLSSPPGVLRTARCIELFDDNSGGTILHNWISYAGFGWPAVILTTGILTLNAFNDFNEALADQLA